MHHIYKRILYLFVFLCFAAISFKANAQYAIGGTAGNLTKSVYWLTWDNSTLLTKPAGWNNTNIINGTYVWQHSPNVRISAVISNKTGGNNMTKYTPGNYTGDGLDLMYSSNNLPKPASRGVAYSGLATIEQATVTFDIEVRVDMLINSVWTEVDYPGMVVADAEELNGQGEYIQGTTPGATAWQVLNKRIGAGGADPSAYRMILSNNGRTFRIQPTAANSKLQVVMFAHNTHKLTGVEMNGGGITAIALGFVLPFDLGDAPASYGDKVGHYIDNFQITDYFNGVGDFPVVTYPETPLVPQSTVYLGPNNNVDADGMPAPGVDAASDNNAQNNDEETINPLTIADLKVNQSGNYVLSFPATNTKSIDATVYGWIDFNNDGKFSALELVTAIVPPNTTNHQVTLTYPNAMFTNVVKPGLLYGRLRITTTPLIDDGTTDIDERSVSYAADGETEDYKLKNILGVTISGGVINDGNGLTDNQISGTGTGTAGTQLYAYLVDQTNTIIARVAVASDGTYSFANTDKGTYTVAISTKNVAVGGNLTDVPATLPAGWNAVGDTYGIDNGNGQTGFETGVPDLQITVVIPADSKDISALNFALNQNPVANNDAATTELDTDVIIDVLSNDTDPNGNGTINPATVLLIDPADNQEKNIVGITGQGVYTVDPVTGKITFNPEPTFLGVATAINYTVKDYAGTKSNQGLLAVKVKPLGTADTDATLMGIAVTTTIKTNDGASATSTSVSQVTPPANGTLLVNTDGTITYTPATGYIGTDTYTYKLTTTDGVESDPITVTITVYNPGITLAKEGTYNDFNANGKVDVGDRINYTFTVTNTGTVPITNIAVTDPNATIAGGPIASLAVNASDNTTFTGYHVLTQAELDNGGVFNSATANGTDPKNNPITTVSNDPTPLDPSDPNYPVTPPTSACPTCTVTEIPQTGSMSLAKEGIYNDFNANGKVDVGDRINYTFTITNTGNVTLTNVTIADANATISGGSLASLAVGTSDNTTFTGYHVLTQAELDNGGVFNTATATAKDPKGRDITTVSNDPTPLDPSDPNYPVTPPNPACPSCTVTEIQQTGSMSLAKEGTYIDFNANGKVDVGDRINYTFTVTNTGNVTLTNISIADVNATITGGPLASLAVGASNSSTFTGYHVLTQAELDNGGVFNTATATAKDPKGKDITTVSNDPTPLDPSDPNYPVKPPTPACPSCTITTLPQSPSMALSKVADNSADAKKAGDVITYTLTVQNTGNVTLTDIVVTDAGADAGSILPAIIATLAPNATATVKASHTLTQAEVNTGSYMNQAAVTGKTPSRGTVTTPKSDDPGKPGTEDPTVVQIIGTPAITLVKSGAYQDSDGNGKANAGDHINYTFKVTNTGNVTVSNISIADPKVQIIGGRVTLAPGVSDNTTFTAIYTITQDDLNKGGVYNLATANGTDPAGNKTTGISTNGNPVDPNLPVDPNCPTCTITAIRQEGGIALTKTVTNTGTGQGGAFILGNAIEYTFVITNTGNVTLNNIVLNDPLLGTASIAIQGSVAPGQSLNHIEKYTISAADIANGKITNQATVNAKDPANKNITDESGTTATNNNPTITTLASPPVAKDDAAETRQNFEVKIPVAGNDVPGNSELVIGTVKVVTPPQHGKVTANPDGTVTYIPDNVYTGSDTFTYTITDKNGQVSNVASVQVNIRPTDPVATDDSGTTAHNTPVNIKVLNNDKEDGSSFNTRNIEIKSQPQHGTIRVNTDGTITYTPNAGYTGPDEFSYRVKDANGNWTNIANVKVVVDGFFIPNVFTPDGDGINDTFFIVGAENYDAIDVEVYNRWGGQVYRKTRYQNDWTGEGINGGTYYYVIKLRKASTSSTLKGWVLIKR